MPEKRVIEVEIFSDGSCIGNPGPGGWAAILRYNRHEREIFGHEEDTTNNRMELKSVIEALSLLKRSCAVNIYTDSQYVQKGMTEWIDSWRKKGFKTKKGIFRKNHDLWLILDDLSKKHNIRWHWVRGHSGHIENERVDVLARKAAMRKSARLD